MNDKDKIPKRTAPNVKEVECKSMLVKENANEGWQPISTLPMDRKVLILFPDDEDPTAEPLTMHYDGRTTGMGTWDEAATHWLYIPEFPS